MMMMMRRTRRSEVEGGERHTVVPQGEEGKQADY